MPRAECFQRTRLRPDESGDLGMMYRGEADVSRLSALFAQACVRWLCLAALVWVGGP
jgi:hypothetical protein